MGYNVDYEYTRTEGYDLDWVPSANRSEVHSYGFIGSRVSSSSPQPRPHNCSSSNADVSSVSSPVQLLASDCLDIFVLYNSEQQAGILGASKEDEKAEKKRLKRQVALST